MDRKGPSDQQRSYRKQSWNPAKEKIRQSRQEAFDGSRAVTQDFYLPENPITHLTPRELESRAISNSQAASRAMEYMAAAYDTGASLHRPVPQPMSRAPPRGGQPIFRPAPSYDEWRSKERLKPGGRSKNEQLGSAVESWGLDHKPRKGMFQHEDSPPSRNVSPFRITPSTEPPGQLAYDPEPLQASSAHQSRAPPPAIASPWDLAAPTPQAPPWPSSWRLPDTGLSKPNFEPTVDRSPQPRTSRPLNDKLSGRPVGEDVGSPWDAFGPVRAIPRRG